MKCFWNNGQDVLNKPQAAVHFKERIPRNCPIVIQHFLNKQFAQPTWYRSFPGRQSSLSPSPPQPLGLEFPKEREYWRQQCPLSGSDQGFIVRKSPFSGPSLSASSNRPSPSPIPCQPTISRLYGNEKLLFFTKKIGGDKVINTYFVQESIRATILEHSFGLWEG